MPRLLAGKECHTGKPRHPSGRFRARHPLSPIKNMIAHPGQQANPSLSARAAMRPTVATTVQLKLRLSVARIALAVVVRAPCLSTCYLKL